MSKNSEGRIQIQQQNFNELEPFGYQLVLDLYGCKPGACDDLTLCYNFLDEIVDFIGMSKQAPPDIFKTDDKLWPDKAGLSGWVPLAESSIVIHTLSVKNFITIDVYSCKKFDNEKVKEFVTRFFHPKKIEEHFIHRGKNYHNHLAHQF